jgi:Phage tail tube protein, GTA-gp10
VGSGGHLMAAHGTIDLIWGDGEHPFRLGIGQLRELQEKTGCGPLELFRRLGQGHWRVDDVRETLRIGLIGGGMKPPDALRLVRRYVDERPLTESVLPAQAVLMVALYGEQEDKKQPGETDRRGSESGQTEGSPSPISTERVQ